MFNIFINVLLHKIHETSFFRDKSGVFNLNTWGLGVGVISLIHWGQVGGGAIRFIHGDWGGAICLIYGVQGGVSTWGTGAGQ